MPNEYKTASIQFLDGTNHGTLYTYALYDEGIVAGDLVVVKTGHHGLALAKVVEVSPEIAAPVKYGRQIAAKVDLSAYEARVQRAKRLSKLKQEMDAKVRRVFLALITCAGTSDMSIGTSAINIEGGAIWLLF